MIKNEFVEKQKFRKINKNNTVLLTKDIFLEYLLKLSYFSIEVDDIFSGFNFLKKLKKNKFEIIIDTNAENKNIKTLKL